jgi:adenosylhomocysteine nucleosidase
VILAACGLQREARLIAKAGLVPVIGGGDAERLGAALEQRCGEASAILSIGLSGALAADLDIGDVVIDAHTAGLNAWLRAALPHARTGGIVGQDSPAATSDDKHSLHLATGALAVDMESHVAARVAMHRGLPFAAIRVVSDDARRTLPPAALVGMRPDGGMALGAVLKSLARHPAQLPALIRTGIDAERAFRALGGALRALETHGISFLDPREFTLDL